MSNYKLFPMGITASGEAQLSGDCHFDFYQEAIAPNCFKISGQHFAS